jgi:hypothetical protein
LAHDVFVSYSSKDKLAADAVCATLERRGIRCWIAPRDILPGMDWSSSIIDGISDSNLVVLVFSSSANDSPQIKRELERAVNKGLPILPFRIENVPLSKTMEYFISTPHWLDALTPPMEKHLNYLAETVEVLLKRKTAGQIVSPPPVPKQKTSNALMWGAIIAALLVIVGGAVVITKLLPDNSKKIVEPVLPSQPEIEEQPLTKEQTVPPQEPLVTKSSLDSRLAGRWEISPVVQGKLWKLKLYIDGGGAFNSTGTSQDTGTYSAQFGKWESRSVNGETDSGTYTFMNPNLVSIQGKLGTGLWSRIRKGKVVVGGRVDPAMVGRWHTSAVFDGKEFQFDFDVHSEGKFDITTTTKDTGIFEADGGKFKQISKNGTVVEGTYQLLSENSVSFSGSAGTGVWTKR